MSDFLHLLLQSNIFNFILVVAIIVYLVRKFNLKQKIEKLTNEIKSYVDESEKEKLDAEKELKNINDKIEKLPSEIDNINRSADNSVKSLSEKIRIETESQKQDILNNAERLLNLETKKFKSKLVGILSEKSVELVQQNTINQLNSNQDLQKKYIDNAISELDRINI